MRPVDFVFLAIIVAGYLLYLWLKNGWPRRKKSTPFTDTDLSRNEKAALKALQDKGYVLQQSHPVVSVTMNVDERKQKEFTHKSNLKVRKDGQTYLVKVVKGENTSALSSASMRRDLLLDQLFFLPAGILVYNVDNNRLQEIKFSFAGYSVLEKKIIRIVLVVLIIIGIAIIGWYLIEGVLSL